MNAGLVIYLLRHFWRIALGVLALVLALLWVLFGFSKMCFIVCITALGYFLGKWMDEGRPNGGVFRVLTRFFE